MANIEVKLRRGTTTEHSTFPGAQGEITVDTDKNTVVVHDGTTAGGHELLKGDNSNLDVGASSVVVNESGADVKVGIGGAVDNTNEIALYGDVIIKDSENLASLTIEQTGATSGAIMYLQAPGNGNIRFIDTNAATGNQQMQLTVGSGQMLFQALSDDGTSVSQDILKLGSSGEVGIAKTADTGYKLDVLGTIRTTDGNLFITGDEAAFGIGNGPGIRIIYDDGAGTLETRDIFVKANGDLDFNNLESNSTPFRIKKNGGLNFGNIPTSSSGLSSGDVWNNSGVLNIVP